MKKAAILLLAMLVAWVTFTTAFAFQNEPEGFRGLEWGDSPTEAIKFIMNSEGSKLYVMPGDKMQLGNVELSRIIYVFWEGQFMESILCFDGEDNFTLMKTLCEERFGESKGYYDDFTWEGAVALMILTYDHFDEDGYLAITSTLLSMEKTQRDKKQEVAKAEGDW